VLDKCYNGDRAGSRFLRDMLASSLLKPRVWLCGHIHEGFGCADCMLMDFDDCMLMAFDDSVATSMKALGTLIAC
jgi:hypothetical protein